MTRCSSDERPIIRAQKKGNEPKTNKNDKMKDKAVEKAAFFTFAR